MEYKKDLCAKHVNIVYLVSQLIIAIALFVLCYRLFYRQSVGYIGIMGNYPSDLKAHIRFGTQGISYSLLIRTIGWLARSFGNEAVAVLESAMVVLTWYLAKRLIEKISGVKSIISLYASLSLIFLTNIHLPIFNYYYKERFISQPWHNITYIGMRLFAVLTFCYFIDLYKTYLNRIALKNYFYVTLFLFLSTAIKPNFFISFAAALLLALVIDFVKDDKRAEHLRKYCIIGSTVFPSCAVLFIQSRMLYPSGFAGDDATRASGIMLVWFSGFFKIGVGMAILKILLSVSLPAMVCMINKGGQRDFRFVGLYFLVSFFIAYVFQESGPRTNDGNFFWGIQCAGYILFLFSFGYLIKNWDENFPKGKILPAIYKILSLILIIGHVYSGLVYFNIVSRGGSYFI